MGKVAGHGGLGAGLLGGPGLAFPKDTLPGPASGRHPGGEAPFFLLFSPGDMPVFVGFNIPYPLDFL
jgi:hypothetical protein